MKLHTISIQSLRRKKLKTFFLFFGIFIAAASVVSLLKLSNTMNESVAKDLDTYGANILITPQTDQLALNYGGISVGDVSYSTREIVVSDVEKIKQIKNSKNISVVSPKLIRVAEMGSVKTLIAGVGFEKELQLKKWWEIEGKVPAEENEILIGSNAALTLGLKISDSLAIRGNKAVVSGILNETGSQDDDIIFADMAFVRTIFESGENVSLIEIAALCYDCPIEEIVRQTSEILPSAKVTAIRQTIDSKMAAVSGFQKFSFGVSALIIFISVLIVLINVNSSLNERIKEIGLYKAVGFSRKNILQILLYEILFSSGAAGIAGYLTGMAAAKLIFPYLGNNEVSFSLIDGQLFLLSMGLSILVGILAAIFPALRAVNMDPTLAFRNL